MKVSILGYGKMGKEVEKVLLRKGYEVVARIDNEEEWKEQRAAFAQSDVAIEFSFPTVAVANIFRCFDASVPVVSGTTGWHGRLDEVSAYCNEKSGALVFGTNFSIGVNLFFKAAAMVAEVLGRNGNYSPEIEEIHHIHKKDKPSGTAITTAETVLPFLSDQKGWISDSPDIPDRLNIVSKRMGEVSGTHILRFSSPADSIELVHTANNRSGFAEGAVKAAEWLLEGHTGVHNFKDVFGEIFK